ncbi:UbiH/UbiF family hydroxylase [Candidatus Pandoraea novymonadis]|uniref:2-octaprenyl-3-methyl-6-methoxy-1,4-benzoquinol hydroxylase n=1 Tax=Candidatus Pandoraea novymonadis TaxID=1808959 RepID=A0ABX5FCV9_9BURK|nr:UbiH/UbiF family hydroxylase [Candidatus Pandoraea novymonadis]PSB91605.1 2-octaprenyl-3-methyl-6-methoxy-1,4-benzoquinol hydroxylase [Candidatus Pandoraea novymonadis]
MIPSQTHEVIVVGGGLIGKATALRLSQARLSVTLLTRPPPPTALSADAWDSRIYSLSSSSQALFEKMNVWQALDSSRLNPVYDIRVFGDGDAHSELHFSAYQASVPQLAWIVELSNLERALDTALRFSPQVHWLNAEVEGLSITEESATLRLKNDISLSASLIVGADGSQSWMRQASGLDGSRRSYKQIGIVCNFLAERPHRDTAFQWFVDGEIIALLPLPEQKVSLVWSAFDKHAQHLLGMEPGVFAEHLAPWVADELGALTPISTKTQGFSLSLAQSKRLIAPRVALVGDAAHTVHPLSGQGMNLGLRDVSVLADIISGRESFRSPGDSVVLRRYERARREDIDSIVLMTDGLQRIFALGGSLTKFIRNTGLNGINALPLLKRFLIGRASG